MSSNLPNNMLFFDMNYGEYASITGTNIVTETVDYGRDNRSDSLVEFNDYSGEYVFNFTATTGYFEIDSLLVSNHNFLNVNLQLNTGTAWYTANSYSALSASDIYLELSATVQCYGAKLAYTAVQDSTTTGFLGEFIVTKKKFQLGCNPNTYVPTFETFGPEKKSWDGKLVFNERSDIFSANMGFNFLEGDANTLTNTDLQNMTELARKKTTFLFWPNANNDFVNMYTWRKQDIFKCKIMGVVSYEFSASNLTNYIKATFDIVETK